MAKSSTFASAFDKERRSNESRQTEKLLYSINGSSGRNLETALERKIEKHVRTKSSDPGSTAIFEQMNNKNVV